MNLDEIKKAVNEGKTVCWANDGYQVIKGKYSWVIEWTNNGNCIGLTHTDGKTLNGKEEEFYIKGDDDEHKENN